MIGCEDRLRNDLYCVEWGVKLYSNQPLCFRLDRLMPILLSLCICALGTWSCILRLACHQFLVYLVMCSVHISDHMMSAHYCASLLIVSTIDIQLLLMWLAADVAAVSRHGTNKRTCTAGCSSHSTVRQNMQDSPL